jgi:pimeloyl-ACP methyl ester carboxylesterase
MPRAEVAGEGLFYTVSRGPEGSLALVLLHGAGGTRLNWPPELRRLADGTVYTLDLPGHGRSEGRGRDTIQGYAEVPIAFLDAIDVERAIVAGHSMGGAIAQTLALDYPDRMAGLVLVATGARLRVAPAILDQIHTDFEEAIDVITRLAWSQEADPAMIKLGRQALAETCPDVLFGDFAACDHFDVMERLHDIDIPTLIISGTADLLTPLKYAHFLTEHIADARLEIIEGAGHMVMLERPAEVAKAVGGFLKTGVPVRI